MAGVAGLIDGTPIDMLPDRGIPLNDAFELFTGLKPQVSAIGGAFDAVMARRYGAAS